MSHTTGRGKIPRPLDEEINEAISWLHMCNSCEDKDIGFTRVINLLKAHLKKSKAEQRRQSAKSIVGRTRNGTRVKVKLGNAKVIDDDLADTAFRA